MKQNVRPPSSSSSSSSPSPSASSPSSSKTRQNTMTSDNDAMLRAVNKQTRHFINSNKVNYNCAPLSKPRTQGSSTTTITPSHPPPPSPPPPPPHPPIIYSELGQTVFLVTSRRLTRVDSCLAHSSPSWSWWAQFMMASHFVRRRSINAEKSLRSSKTVP